MSSDLKDANVPSLNEVKINSAKPTKRKQTETVCLFKLYYMKAFYTYNAFTFLCMNTTIFAQSA